MNNKSLIDQISSSFYLKNAWKKLNKSNKESRGLSSDTIQEFENSLDSNIQELSNQLQSKKFRFNRVRGVLIRKKEPGKYRELRIADIRDRLVLKALSIKLDQLLTEIYDLNNECSFAYRPKKNVEDAIAKMVHYYQQGYHHILEADIINFFGTVDRRKLLSKILPLLPDESLNSLIIEGLSQEVGNIEELQNHTHIFETSLSGIPQGNSLSPLMANIYLSEFDKRIKTEGFKMIRYADDFIIMCRNHSEAQRALEIAKEEIEGKLGLSIHPLQKADDEKGKTRIINPVYHKFSFLSIRFDGKEVWVNQKKVKQLKEVLMKINEIQEQTTLLTILKKTKNVLEGWLSAFKFVDVDRNFSEIDDYINHILFNSLRKMDFVFRPANIATVKIDKKERQALNETQRKRSGVPTCSDFLSNIQRNKIIINSD